MLLKFVKDKHIPKKTVKYNKHLHMKSKWRTNGLLRSIKMKDKLYKTLLQTTVNTDLFIALKIEFKFYQKVLRRSIREAKYLYYTKTVALYKGDMKRTWSVIKDTLQRKTKCEPPCSFIHDGYIINNPNEIAKEFNLYFISVSQTIANDISAPWSFDKYLTNNHNLFFCFTQIEQSIVTNIIHKLKNKSSHGYDNISNKLLKRASDIIVKPLTIIINQSLSTGIFPKQLKISRVKPLKKKMICLFSVIIDQFHCYFQYQKYLNMLFLINCLNILHPIVYFVVNNSVFVLVIQPS